MISISTQSAHHKPITKQQWSGNMLSLKDVEFEPLTWLLASSRMKSHTGVYVSTKASGLCLLALRLASDFCDLNLRLLLGFLSATSMAYWLVAELRKLELLATADSIVLFCSIQVYTQSEVDAYLLH